ncbi:ABC transporter permease [Nocardioides sp. cx-173]|uniref:ABC transporter permease n=1 Tax=Nocardioides sp. cx-173 TaxID=2898796 RepID=UPI001E61E43C|nr:ABC transporter permease [Nocardioides sp. cx-173]MCD4524043.1 ABC transporter permease [Nocardioides sp. cx-173]UGB41444.1 ABC transporter permease [Nocardioides sp. cx-173]
MTRFSWWWVLVVVALALPVAAYLADAPDLTSAGLAGATLRFSVPILLAGLGGLWAERSGTLNLGLDGMMIIGGWTGAFVGLQYGPWAALVGGVVGGVLTGLLHAVITLAWGVDQAIAGIVINMAALGVVRFLSSITFAQQDGGSISQSPTLEPVPTVTLPGASWLLDPVADAGLPFLSAWARILTGLVTDVSVATIIGLLLVPVTWWTLAHSRFGLHVRACGENPSAADSLGVSPYRIRYQSQAISGALAGLGGAYLVVAASSVYREGQVAGRGFIGLATVLFGNWTPGGVLGGSLLFGFTDALSTRQAASVSALLLIGGVALALRALSLLRQGRGSEAWGNLVVGLAVLIWFVWGPPVPRELVVVAPYLTTLLVLVVARQALRPPAAVGIAYRRSDE